MLYMLKTSSGIRRLDRITLCTSAIKYRTDIFTLSDLSKNSYEAQAIPLGPYRYVHGRHHHQHQALLIHHPPINTSVSVHLSNSLIGGIASS
jgi:hypothetical protein